MKKQPTHYSEKEVRQKLYEHMRSLCDYWSKVDNDWNKTEKQRMEGLCFSLLVLFDGYTCADLPAFDIRLSPHKDDKKFHVSRGERWFKKNMLINDCLMHDEWCNSEKNE